MCSKKYIKDWATFRVKGEETEKEKCGVVMSSQGCISRVSNTTILSFEYKEIGNEKVKWYDYS